MEKYYGIIALVIYVIGLVIFLRYQAKHEDEDEGEETVSVNNVSKSNVTPLDPNDEDAMVASLIAAIECRNENKKNVRVVSVRKVS